MRRTRLKYSKSPRLHCAQAGLLQSNKPMMSYDSNTLMVWLIWVHGAFLFVPALALMLMLEWEELRERVPTRRSRRRYFHLNQPA